MSFDPVATAVDWLDAYRVRNLDAMLSMFAEDATVECNCCVTATVTGHDQLKSFWADRFKDCGTSEIHDLVPHIDGASITYVARDGMVTATLIFADHGKVTFLKWGPVAVRGLTATA